jgi:hypothetical protein
MGRVVSIPKRGSLCGDTLKGRKPPRLATEVSIPKRDSIKERFLLSLPLSSYDTG